MGAFIRAGTFIEISTIYLTYIHLFIHRCTKTWRSDVCGIFAGPCSAIRRAPDS